MCCSCRNDWRPCADEFGTLFQKLGIKSELHHVWRTWCISSAFPVVVACLCRPNRITQFHSIWWIVLEFWALMLLKFTWFPLRKACHCCLVAYQTESRLVSNGLSYPTSTCRCDIQLRTRRWFQFHHPHHGRGRRHSTWVTQFESIVSVSSVKINCLTFSEIQIASENKKGQ